MLTSEPPFSGDMASVLKDHVSTPAPRPSLRVPGVSVPPDIEKIVLKALEKQSSKRHLTLRQLLSELEAAAGMPARVVPPSVPLTARSPSKPIAQGAPVIAPPVVLP